MLSVIDFFFNDTATTEIYTLSLHDALPIYAKSSDMVRAPVKTLAVTSEMAGVSVSPLNLLMILSTTSERGGARVKSCHGYLLILAFSLATRLSDIPLNP